MGYAWGPAGIAALIGPPLSAALLGKDYIWWRGVVFASVCSVWCVMVYALANMFIAFSCAIL